MDWAGFIARCTWKIFEMITKINYQFIWKGKSKCLKLPPIYILETLANPTLRLGHLSLMCVNIYALTQAHQTEIDYMSSGQSIFFTEVSFSTRWGSPVDVTLTVSEKKVFPQTWFWLCLSCRTLLLLEPRAILANSWLHVRRRLKYYCSLPQQVSLVTSLAEEKKMEANRGNKLSMACFNILMTVWELPLMTTLGRIWNISFSK